MSNNQEPQLSVDLGVANIITIPEYLQISILAAIITSGNDVPGSEISLNSSVKAAKTILKLAKEATK